MYRGATVAVVMPAYNVERHVALAISAVPSFVDHLVVVDDGSTDTTAASIKAAWRPGLVHLRHPHNRGVGAAISTGYVEALRIGAQLVVVMAGDGQMDPADLTQILDPLMAGEADYVKGNRFRHPDVWQVMPPERLFGNIVLSLLTKVTSGYWRLFDSQCGYTAISRRALEALWSSPGTMFSRYGYPNDILARLRAVKARVVDVKVRPIYEGQPSGIRLWTVVYPILFVLLRSMVRRLWRQRLRPRLPGRREVASIDGAVDGSSDRMLTAP